MVSSWFLALKKLLKFNLRLLMKGFSKAATSFTLSITFLAALV